MASFDFESITVSQAANFNAAVDSLNFQTAGATGAMVTVAYIGAGPDQVAVTLGGQTMHLRRRRSRRDRELRRRLDPVRRRSQR